MNVVVGPLLITCCMFNMCFLNKYQDARIAVITTVSVSITILALVLVLFYHVLWIKSIFVDCNKFHFHNDIKHYNYILMSICDLNRLV